jgi:lipopolysaccharide exporter
MNNKIAKGAAWMMLLKLVERSIGLLSVLILARLLTPADFGLVAMATSVVALTELMGAFGFDTALIQRQSVDRTHYDTAWTFNVLFGAAISLLVLAMALPAADFFNDPRLKWVLPVLSLGALAGGFENIGTVNFRKDLNFSQEFRFLVAKKIIAFAVTVCLALTFRSYWALVGGIVTGKLCAVLISYRVHPYRPRFSLAASQELFHFSKWLFISNLVLFLQNTSANFILGRTVGAHALGIYSVAAELAVLPSTELVAPINRAAFPAYSRLSQDLPDLRSKFLNVFGTIAVVAFPFSIGLACVALLGPQWGQAVPLLQIFTVCGLASALQSNLYVVIVAMGKPKLNTLMSAGMLIVYLPVLVAATISFGVLGAAWAHCIMSIVVLVPLHIVFLRLTGLRPKEYFGTLWRPCLASLTMAGTILVIQKHSTGLMHALPIMELLAYVIAGAFTYIVAALGLWWLAGRPEASAESALLRIVLRKVHLPSKAYP